MRVEPGELDLDRFEQVVADGRRALNDGVRSVGPAAARGRSLWRGPPLEALDFRPSTRLDVERLEELRLSVIEERVEAELALGRHAALVRELETLVAQHPLRETGRAQLMLALYRSGRHVEALDGYRAARKHIDEEFGLHPGARLRELETAILQQDAALELPTSDHAAAVPLPPPARGTAVERWPLDGAGAAIAGVAALALAVRPLRRLDPGRGNPADPRAMARSVLASRRPGPCWTRYARCSADPRSRGLRLALGDSISTRHRLRGRWRRAGRCARRSASATARAELAGRRRGRSGWPTRSTAPSRASTPTPQAVVQTIPSAASRPPSPSAAGAVWVANRGDGTVAAWTRAAGGSRRCSVSGADPTALAVAGGSIWVANQDAGRCRASTRAPTVVQTTHVGTRPQPSQHARAASGSPTVFRLDRVEARPRARLIASTFPMRGITCVAWRPRRVPRVGHRRG